MLLTKKIIKKMRKSGAGKTMDLVIFKDCGHVPSLMAPAHIEAIQGWLKKS